MRQRHAQIDRATSSEFSFVEDMISSKIAETETSPFRENLEYKRLLRSLWSRHALQLPPGWFRKISRCCHDHLKQSPVFHSPIVARSPARLTEVTSLAKVVFELRRTQRQRGLSGRASK